MLSAILLSVCTQLTKSTKKFLCIRWANLPISNECRTAETAKSTVIFWQYILWELFREIADCSNILKLYYKGKKKYKFKYNNITNQIYKY